MAIKFRRVKRRARKNAVSGMNLGFTKSPIMIGAAIVGGIFLLRYLAAKKAAVKTLPSKMTQELAPAPSASDPAITEAALQGIGGGIFKGGF
jgi:hypothetical protein